MVKVEIIGLKMHVIEGPCNIVEEILNATKLQGVEVVNGDVIVITDELMSKCLGKVVKVDEIKPSKSALRLARKTNLDPRFIELVLRNCDDIVAVIPIKKIVEKGLVDLKSLAGDVEAMRKLLDEYPDFFITIREGMLWSDSGIDSSNLPPGYYAIPVENHDEVAKMIRDGIQKATGREVAVVVCDIELFLGGSLDFARGSWGIDPVDRCFGCRDLYGKPRYGGVDIVVHEICSAASLLFKQTAEGVPVAIVRGLKYKECECGLRDALPRVRIGKVIKEVIIENLRVLGVKGFVKLLRSYLTT
jgi:coenzyme F420-0:L-glutamate ligase/coenzyme F420-1:gamma-L-glutamate ligase